MHSHEHERTSSSLLTIEQVCERTTLGRTSIYNRLREDETFPKPVRPADSGPTRSPNPAQADHRFRFNPITDSGRTRSPIPVSSRSLFRGGRNRSGRLV